MTGSLALYLQEIKQIPQLSEDEEEALAQKVRRGDKKAFLKLYLASLHYIPPVAFSRQGWARKRGLDVSDLIQEANSELIRALPKWENNGQGKLGSYVAGVARLAIKNALGKYSSMIYIPSSRQQEIRKLIRAQLELEERLGHPPSIYELALRSGKSPEEVREIQEAMRIFYVPPVSLEASIGDGEGGRTWEEIIPDPRSLEPFEDPEENPVKKKLKEFVYEHTEGILDELLNPLEQYMLRLYFRIEDGTQWSFRKIGKKFKVRPEKIKDIIGKAIAKLKRDERIREWLKLSFSLKKREKKRKAKEREGLKKARKSFQEIPPLEKPSGLENPSGKEENRKIPYPVTPQDMRVLSQVFLPDGRRRYLVDVAKKLDIPLDRFEAMFLEARGKLQDLSDQEVVEFLKKNGWEVKWTSRERRRKRKKEFDLLKVVRLLEEIKDRQGEIDPESLKDKHPAVYKAVKNTLSLSGGEQKGDWKNIRRCE